METESSFTCWFPKGCNSWDQRPGLHSVLPHEQQRPRYICRQLDGKAEQLHCEPFIWNVNIAHGSLTCPISPDITQFEPEEVTRKHRYNKSLGRHLSQRLMPIRMHATPIRESPIRTSGSSFDSSGISTIIVEKAVACDAGTSYG